MSATDDELRKIIDGDDPHPITLDTEDTAANAAAAAKGLTKLLGLDKVGLTVTGGRIVGRGSTASADLYLSDGTAITFEKFGDLANATRLKVELATCTGATPTIKATQALTAVALLRILADHLEVVTTDHLATGWGLDYIQAAAVIDVAMADQAGRWEAFAHLKTHPDPYSALRDREREATTIAAASTMLRDTDGTLLVRRGWFRSHVRAEDHTVAPYSIPNRMHRVGWQSRGKEGLIKATRPELGGTRSFSFYVVPPDWQADSR